MHKRVLSLRQAVGLILLVGLLLRLLVFAYIAFEPRKFYTYDSDGYDRRAVNLLQYGMLAGEAQPPLTPDLERTPVYPALLAGVFAVFGHVPAAVILLQILVGSFTGVLVFLLVRELELPHWAGVLAGLFIAVDPVSLMTANRLLTETVFTALLVASVLTLVVFWRRGQARWLLVSAVLFALMALTRPISQVLPFAVLPLFVGAARRWKLKHALLYGMLFVALSTGLTYSWAVRNYQQTGVFTLSTISDTNLIYYRARAVLAEAQHTSQDKAWKQLQDRITTQARAQNLTPGQTLNLQRKEAIGIFAAHPLMTAKMFGSGVARIFVDPGYTISCTLLDRTTTAFDCFPGKSSMNEPGLIGQAIGKIGTMTLVQQVALLWSVLLLAVVYVGALLGMGSLLWRRNWMPLLLLGIVTAYFVFLAAGAEANSRFRIPAIPFLAAFAGVGLYNSYIWYRQRRRVAQPASDGNAPSLAQRA